MVSMKSSTKIVKFMAPVYGVQILGRGQYMSILNDSYYIMKFTSHGTRIQAVYYKKKFRGGMWTCIFFSYFSNSDVHPAIVRSPSHFWWIDNWGDRLQNEAQNANIEQHERYIQGL